MGNMSTELTVTEKKAQQLQWLQERGLTNELWSSLNSSIFPGAKPESIIMALNYCKARGLDPLKKPVHIVPLYVKDAKTGQSSMRDVIMPGIYELRMTAARTGSFVGMDEPAFGPMIEFKGVTAPAFCSITVYRMVAGQRCAFTHTEYFEEAVSIKKEGGKEVGPNAMWTKRPRGQLAKCAEAGALRKAFPDELGGIQSSEEAVEFDSSSIDKPVGGSSVVDLEAEILNDLPVTPKAQEQEEAVDAEIVEPVAQIEPEDEYISQAQINEIIALLQATETLEADYCNHIKVDCLETIKATMYEKSKELLVRKYKKLNKPQEEQQ
jgi:phage recombination protein Bet